MLKYAKVINKQKQCEVGLGTNAEFYKSIGMEEMKVEQAYNGNWYIAGFAPQEPESEKNKKIINELKNELNATDYKIIKCSECSLAGEPLPYDIQELHAQRQELRNKINELEND